MAKYVIFPKVPLKDRTWPDQQLDKAPRWVSVDLRDGNQALINPMSVEQKLDMFDMLLQIGFKEIEVGFPSASQIEYDFTRQLIEENRIPDDVFIQVLCQARQHLVDRTFESLEGAKKVIFHLYSSTSPAHRRYTFNVDKVGAKKIAVDGVHMVKSGLSRLKNTEILFEYSPESFTQTELDFALEVCEAVHEAWGFEQPIILNLPATVEVCPPNIHADQIEWFSRHKSHRDKVTISLHTHNDRGTGIASAEMGLLAGAQRVEGTLFGNGERTGNLDIVTMALNFYSQGVDPGLDFSNLPDIVRRYEEFTEMYVHPRHPYAGQMVFTAFSGSHQDAIKKALDARRQQNDPEAPWDIPYLPVDPLDLGRSYEAVIRINAQSGKGGVAYILREKFGLEIPKQMYPEVGRLVNDYADKKGKELTAEEIWQLYEHEYLSKNKPIKLLQFEGERIEAKSHLTTFSAKLEVRDQVVELKGEGHGPLDAFVNGLRKVGFDNLTVVDFHENAVSTGSEAKAAAFICINSGKNHGIWGCGIHESITEAGVEALISAINRAYP
jgi:2-isopropylmalate synthase